MTMATTIKDVAALAGVSPSTVSRVCNDHPSISRETRLRVRQAMQERGIPIYDEYCFFGAYDENAGYNAGSMIANMSQRPTAIVAASDIIAIGAMRALQERGITIPNEIAIIGLDNINFDRSLTPQLSSQSMMQAEIGKTAVEILMSRIGGEKSAPKKIVYQTELIERASSKYAIRK